MEINNYRAILHSIVKTEAEWNTINTVIPVNQVVYAVVSKTENVLNYYVKVGDGIHNFVELPKGNLTTAEIREIVATINQNIDTKVTLTNEPLQIYGTDENGNQTTFDFDLLGLVDDVLVKNTSLDEYHTVIEDQKAYIDLSGKIDHFDTMPLASSANEGQVIQYTGEDTEDYISGCFYESKEEHLESSITITPSVVEIESSIDKDTFESFVQPTGDMTLIFEYIEAPVESGDVSGSVVLESFWTLDGVEVELEDYGITTTGPVIDGDQLTVEYEYGYLEYHWVKKDTTDISHKVEMTDDANRIYGTDSEGHQTTYDMDMLGLVDDVRVKETLDDEYHTVIENQIAYIDLSGKVSHYNLLPEATEDNLGQVVQYTGSDTDDLISGCFYQSSEVSHESEITITPSYEEIEASVNKETFESFVHPTEDTTLVFEYVCEGESGEESGSGALVGDWTLNGEVVDLSDYGIEASGIIVDGDTLTVDYTAESTSIEWVRKDTTDISEKVDKTHDSLKIYGTDENGEQKLYDKEDFGKVDDVQLNGTSVVDRTTKIANLEPGASDIAYTNEQYPAMQTLQDAMDKLLYITPTLSVSGGSTKERGESVSSVTVTWTWNKKISSQSLTVSGQSAIPLDPNARSYTYTPSNPITSNTTFTISGTDGTTSKSGSTSVSFIIKKYYGASAVETPTDSDIRALTNATSSKTLASTSFNFGSGKYWYYVLPVETYNKTDLVFSIGPAGSEALQSGNYFIYRKDDFQNAQGVTIPVTIYKFKKTPAGLPDMLTGTANVKVA